MEAQDKRENGICIVSFGMVLFMPSVVSAKSTNLNLEDGGGPGAISQLVIMNEILRAVEYDQDLEEGSLCPADYWDLMGGVGFGG